MELRNSWDLQKVLIAVFFVILGLYLAVGLTPVRAAEAEAATEITVPKIGLTTGVALLSMENGKLNTPDEMVGSYSRANNKTFLVGHSVGVFRDLGELELGDEIYYDLVNYVVVNIEILEKNSISMNKLLAPADVDTIVIMTCAGELTGTGDASHRLIITAEAR